MVKQCGKGSVMAKGRLGKAEKYIIEGMFNDGHTADEIVEETGRSKAVVEKYITEQGGSFDPATKKGKNSTQFLRRTASKNDGGVSIMTENESTRYEMEKGQNQSKIVPKLKVAIHTIHDEEG